MSKDWVGGKNSVYTTIGATNHAVDKNREENDFYATDPKAIDILLDPTEGNFKFPTKELLEPSCGVGHLSEKLKQYGYNVTSFDLIDRGYGQIKDFFDIKQWNGSIITNPPFKYATEFVEHALKIIPDRQYVVMFLKLTFLEGKARKSLYKKYPLETLYVSSSRLGCLKNAKLGDKIPGSAVAYGWFVWKKGYTGDSKIRWIN